MKTILMGKVNYSDSMDEHIYFLGVFTNVKDLERARLKFEEKFKHCQNYVMSRDIAFNQYEEIKL